jgi:hypothetical protein
VFVILCVEVFSVIRVFSLNKMLCVKCSLRKSHDLTPEGLFG